MKQAVLIRFAAAALLIAAAQPGWADTLQLRDGKTIDGMLIGVTADTLYLRTQERLELIDINDVASLRFEKRAGPESQAGSGSPGNQRAVIVAAGSKMMVALPEAVIQGNVRPGETFKATLSEDFTSGDVLVAQAGSEVQGQAVNPQLGGIELVLTELTASAGRLNIKTVSRPLPMSSDSAGGVEFQMERPFTFRLASN